MLGVVSSRLHKHRWGYAVAFAALRHVLVVHHGEHKTALKLRRLFTAYSSKGHQSKTHAAVRFVVTSLLLLLQCRAHMDARAGESGDFTDGCARSQGSGCCLACCD